MVPITDAAVLKSQCKQCDGVITSEESVADHLVDQALRGWCERCYSGRHTAISPNQTATDYLKSGNAAYARGEWSSALNDYNRAIEVDPNLAPAHANRGLVYLIQGKRADAEKGFLQCLHLEGRLKPALQKSIKEIMQRLAAKRHN
ncbi:MAG TPA: tetratricopeptide repeat protein [Blastocatellia bacterium]|nr:tetratricopeptide repeat protein [Blastocatellia bacterium]